jgi:hypothetical protein
MRSAAGQDLTVRPYGKWDVGGALRVEGEDPQDGGGSSVYIDHFVQDVLFTLYGGHFARLN